MIVRIFDWGVIRVEPHEASCHDPKLKKRPLSISYQLDEACESGGDSVQPHGSNTQIDSGTRKLTDTGILLPGA